MSVSPNVLLLLKESLRKIGGYKVVADELGCSPEWVGQVIRDPLKARKHPQIITKATELIRKSKEEAKTMDSAILEAIK